MLAQHGAALLPALFALVQRLEDVESKVRVLQLVSVSIEALGETAGPLLGSVAGALPMVSVLVSAAASKVSVTEGSARCC